MKRTVIILMLITVLTVACAPKLAAAPALKEAPPFVEPGFGGEMPEALEAAPPAPMPTMVAERASVANDASKVAPQERLVIQNADLTIVVPDPASKMEEIQSMAERMGGFVVSSNLYQTSLRGGGSAPEGSITVRVPAEKMDQALAEIKADVVEVRSETRSGQDVTAEYVDLQSRLRNLEAAEERLTEIMAQAEKTEDVLAVFEQLTYYREQIEIVRGQMKYYEESAAYSAISVRLIAEATIQPIEVGGWKPQGTARDAIQNLIYFYQDFVDFLIWLVLNILPKLLTIALVFGTPIWLLVRGIRRWRARRKARKEALQGQNEGK